MNSKLVRHLALTPTKEEPSNVLTVVLSGHKWYKIHHVRKPFAKPDLASLFQF